MESPVVDRSLTTTSEHERNGVPSLRSFQSDETIVTRTTTVFSDTDHKRYSRPQQWVPTFLRPWVVGSIVALTILYALIIQIALRISQSRNGWYIPDKDYTSIISFLKSALPLAAVMPLGLLYNSMHESLLQLQAYVVLSQGRATARETVLLNYKKGRLSTIYTAIVNGHWIVLVSSTLTIVCLLLSPLASGILTYDYITLEDYRYPVVSKKKIGLHSEFASLEYFDAAAGYAQAAAYHNLSDPAFVYDHRWAVAEFTLPPQPYDLFGNVLIPTTAISTECHCGQARSIDLTLASAPGENHAVKGTWNDSIVTFSIPNTGRDQYGVQTITESPSNEAWGFWYKPVAFWFFSSQLNQVAMVFCSPELLLYNVLVSTYTFAEGISELSKVDRNVPENNISGAPMYGRGFNGISFDYDSSDEQSRTREASISSGLATAIYQLAILQPGGIPAVMRDKDGFWSLTKRTYTRYLSIVAKYAYFTDTNETIYSKMSRTEGRIVVYPLVARSLSAILLCLAIVGAFIHFLHARARKDVHLAGDPDSIAATIAMTSHSKFTSLLDASDSESVLAEKLRGMRCMDSAEQYTTTTLNLRHHMGKKRSF
ncbi:hypothetical protein FRC02_001109 [Tulasnella sp. 418]|nr:hypothetical protein FRC02_001109 [Tulasnella sp. 418]